MVVTELQTYSSLVWISSTCMHARTSELRAAGRADLILDMMFFHSGGSFSYSLLLTKGSLFEEIVLEVVSSCMLVGIFFESVSYRFTLSMESLERYVLVVNLFGHVAWGVCPTR
jgi:hypothetical protein